MCFSFYGRGVCCLLVTNNDNKNNLPEIAAPGQVTLSQELCRC